MLDNDLNQHFVKKLIMLFILALKESFLIFLNQI